MASTHSASTGSCSRPRAPPRRRRPTRRARSRTRTAISTNEPVLQAAVARAGPRACASKPAETSISSGAKAAARGQHDALEQRQPQRLAGARRDRQVDRVALPRARAGVLRAARCPGTAATGGCSRTARRARRRKISAVPLPWWTSQSSTNTRCRPSSAIAAAAATATLLNRQKPIARSRSAWWPDGRTPQKPDCGLARQQRGRHRAGAAGGVQRGAKEASTDERVGVDRAAPARAQLRDRAHVRGAVDELELLLAGGRAPRAAPSRASRARRARAPARPAARACRGARARARAGRAPGRRGG